MKKVGVMTFSRSVNYGAFLQAFALQKVLTKNGYDSSLIDYENEIDKKRYKLIQTDSVKHFVGSVLFLPVNAVRKSNFKKCTNRLKYSSLGTKYDIAITGSDQVWNPKLVGNKIEEKFFLSGIKANKKISYAASVANLEVVNEFKDDFCKYISKLDNVSVREISAKESLEAIIDDPVAVVADPTLLLKKEEWEEELTAIKKDEKQYIFSYFVGGINKNERKALASVCKRLNMRCLGYSKKPLERYMYKYAYMDGPLVFLARLRDARLVLTSSFHGVVLSIVMHKNFYYFLPRSDRRSRIDSILRLLGLTDRIIEDESDIKKINLKDIDYTQSQKKLDKLRQESLNWLKKALEN